MIHYMKTYNLTIGESETEVYTSPLMCPNDSQLTSYVKFKIGHGPEGCFARVDMQESNVTLYANKVRGRLYVDMIEDDIIDMSAHEELAIKVIMGHTNK